MSDKEESMKRSCLLMKGTEHQYLKGTVSINILKGL